MAAVPLAMYAGQTIGERISRELSAPYEASRKQLQQEIGIYKQKREAALREENRKNTEILQGLRQNLLEANKTYFKDTENLKASLKIEEDAVADTFSRIIAKRRQLDRDLEGISESAVKKSGTLLDSVSKIQAGITDRKLVFTAEQFSPTHQFMIFEKQAKRAIEAASKLQATAQDDRQEKLADEAWRRAAAYTQMVSESAKESGNLGLQYRAIDLLNQADSRRISALKKQSDLQTQLAAQADTRAKQSKAHTTELDKDAEHIKALLKTTIEGEEGAVTFKAGEQLKKDLAQATKLIAEFRRKAERFGEADYAKAFLGDKDSFADLRREATRLLEGTEIQQISAAPSAIARLKDQVEEGLSDLRVEFPIIVSLETATGESVENGIEKLIRAFESKSEGITPVTEDLFKSLFAGQTAFDEAIRKFKAGVASRTDVNTEGKGYGPDSDAERAKIQALIQQMEDLRNATSITDTQLIKLGQSVRAIDWQQAFPRAWNLPSLAEQLKTVSDALIKLKQAQSKIPSQEQQTEYNKIHALQLQIDEINKKKAAEEAAKQPLQDQLSAINANTSAAASLKSMWDSVTMSIYSAAMASQAGTAKTASQGGMVYRAMGGGIRGTDTVPAMLSKGEYVVNAAMARKWKSQLVAMNAGLSPDFKSQGGTITNVGDISVTVEGGRTEQATAKRIGREIRREIRKGAFSF
jgi:hypothetical protein